MTARHIIGGILLTTAIATAAQAQAPATAPVTTTANGAATAATTQPAVERQLNKNIPELKVDRVTFKDMIDFLRDISGANLLVDPAALKAAGGSGKSPISLHLTEKTLKASLEQVLKQVGNGKLSASPVGSIIVITSDANVAAMQKQYALDAAKGGNGDPVHLSSALPDVNFNAIALSDVIDFLCDATGVNINVDWVALKAVGVTKDAPITFRLRQVPLHEALRAVLNCASVGGKPLDFTVDKKVITIAPAATGA